MTYGCSGCDTRWTGLATCHCANCHNTFGSITSFDAHRRGYGDRGSCKSPAHMGLVLDEKGIYRYPAAVTEDTRSSMTRNAA